MDPFLGMIAVYGFNYAPYGWALCLGQIVPINQYTTLYSLLGTKFGGDGKVNFGLPDLRDSAAIGSSSSGAGAGLTPYPIGARGGIKSITLNVNHLPAHVHQLNFQLKCNAGRADTTDPNGNYPSLPDNGNAYGAAGDLGTVTMKGPEVQLDQTGGNYPLKLQPPMLAVNYSIALQGMFPERG